MLGLQLNQILPVPVIVNLYVNASFALISFISTSDEIFILPTAPLKFVGEFSSPDTLISIFFDDVSIVLLLENYFKEIGKWIITFLILSSNTTF